MEIEESCELSNKEKEAIIWAEPFLSELGITFENKTFQQVIKEISKKVKNWNKEDLQDE